MNKNRTAQLIFQTIYCTLGFVGIVASLGIFDDINMIRWDFYVHFTNLINFLCIGVMLTALISDGKEKRGQLCYCRSCVKVCGNAWYFIDLPGI